MKNPFFILILFSLLGINNIVAQHIRAFSPDHEEAIKEIDNFIQNISNKKVKKEIEPQVNAFIEHWKTGIIPDTVKDDIIANGSLMLSRRLKNYPHMYLYLRDIDLMMGHNISAQEYFIWNKHYDSYRY